MVRILIKLALISVLAFAAVKVWYGRVEDQLRQDSAAGAAAPSAAVQKPGKKTKILRKPDDYTIIVQRNIFKAVLVKTEEPEAKEETPAGPPPPKLKLSLMGTIDGDEKMARAIISDDSKREQDIYQIGDSIQGAMIQSIGRGRVVLTVNGKEEVLSLKDREGGGQGYTPSPGDFYQEPPEQQMPPDFPPDMPPDMTQDMPTDINPESGIDPGMDQGTDPGNPARRRPTVRPRPVRRAPNMGDN